MARKKPAKKKSTRKQTRKNTDLKPGVSVEELIALAEQRHDSDVKRKAFADFVNAAAPGTVGAAKLVTAADAIEDEDLLIFLSKAGFLEALQSHTLRRRISDEAAGLVDKIADIQAAVAWSSPDDRYPNAWIVAEFGDAVAINGAALNDDDKFPERPKDLVLTNHGGRIPVTEEHVLPGEIAASVTEGLGLSKVADAEKAVLEALSEENPDGIPVTVSGETEIWLDEATAQEVFDVSVVEESGVDSAAVDN